MVVAGVIIRDAGTIKLSSDAVLTALAKPFEVHPPLPAPPNPIKHEPTPNGINFNISLKVDMQEMASWEATRIAAFFKGIADVLAAKGSADKNQ